MECFCWMSHERLITKAIGMFMLNVTWKTNYQSNWNVYVECHMKDWIPKTIEMFLMNSYVRVNTKTIEMWKAEYQNNWNVFVECHMKV